MMCISWFPELRAQHWKVTRRASRRWWTGSVGRGRPNWRRPGSGSFRLSHAVNGNIWKAGTIWKIVISFYLHFVLRPLHFIFLGVPPVPPLPLAPHGAMKAFSLFFFVRKSEYLRPKTLMIFNDLRLPCKWGWVISFRHPAADKIGQA